MNPRIRSSNLFYEQQWTEDLDNTLAEFTEQGFEPGQRFIIEDEKRPAVVMEFRKPAK